MFEDSFVAKARENGMAATCCASYEDYEALLGRDPAEQKLFNDSLRVNYSEFFRNSLTFSTLEHIILPTLIRKAREENRRELRIWSAGCALGQEPYSVAILIEELGKIAVPPIDYRIFATDLSMVDIAAAHAGCYSAESLGNISGKRLDRWFSHKNSVYTISPELTSHIEFSAFDLLDAQLSSPPSSIFGGFDLILCCNLLFYYKPEYRKSILDKLILSLGREAYLVCGETERGYIIENGFREVYLQSAIFKPTNV